ncbi:MAG: hypothetical protein R2861_14955 [Desulfobacterales bacterium]
MDVVKLKMAEQAGFTPDPHHPGHTGRDHGLLSGSDVIFKPVILNFIFPEIRDTGKPFFQFFAFYLYFSGKGLHLPFAVELADGDNYPVFRFV